MDNDDTDDSFYRRYHQGYFQGPGKKPYVEGNYHKCYSRAAAFLLDILFLGMDGRRKKKILGPVRIPLESRHSHSEYSSITAIEPYCQNSTFG